MNGAVYFHGKTASKFNRRLFSVGAACKTCGKYVPLTDRQKDGKDCFYPEHDHCYTPRVRS